MCTPTIAKFISETRGAPMVEIGYYHLRLPFKPMTVGEFAFLLKTKMTVKAVLR